jgi:hypothetical protein
MVQVRTDCFSVLSELSRVFSDESSEDASLQGAQKVSISSRADQGQWTDALSEPFLLLDLLLHPLLGEGELGLPALLLAAPLALALDLLLLPPRALALDLVHDLGLELLECLGVGCLDCPKLV